MSMYPGSNGMLLPAASSSSLVPGSLGPVPIWCIKCTCICICMTAASMHGWTLYIGDTGDSAGKLLCLNFSRCTQGKVRVEALNGPLGEVQAVQSWDGKDAEAVEQDEFSLDEL